MRFLANVPTAGGESLPVERLFFQIQQAHWFYEDFYVDDLDHIPHMRFRQFIAAMFEHGTLLERYSSRREEFLELFKEYAARIPSCGAIILNKAMTKILMVQPFGGKSWSFPKGKVNEGETDIDCASREVMEETGVDISSYTTTKDFVAYYNGGQLIKLFIARGIPESVHAAPIARKEIKAVTWHDVSGIPTRSGIKGASKYWSAVTVMKQLLRWIRSKGGKVAKSQHPRSAKGSKKGPRGSSGAGPAASSAGGGDADAYGSLSETFGDEATGEGWSVDAMFRANAKLLGREFRYDGNPHTFGSDCHDDAAASRGTPPSGGVAGKGGRRGAPQRQPKRAAAAGGRGSGSKGSRKGSADSEDGSRSHHRRGVEHSARERHSDSLDETFGAGSASSSGWSVDDMFKRNAEMLGIKFTFDGNPHTFGDASQRHTTVAASASEKVPSAREFLATLTKAKATASVPTPSAVPAPSASSRVFPAMAKLAAFEPDMARVMAAFDAAIATPIVPAP